MTIYPARDPEKMLPCSACGNTVSRVDCHKNRFGEYICWECQEDGIKATKKQKSRYYLKRAAHWSVMGLLITLPVILIFGLVFAFF